MRTKLDFIHSKISIFETGSQTGELELTFRNLGKTRDIQKVYLTRTLVV